MTIDPAAYADLRDRHDRNVDWAKQFTQRNGWIVIPAGAPCPVDAEIDNAQRSALEEYDWHANPPDRYFLYIDTTRKVATTWTGDVLGYVEFGHAFRDNFGGNRVPVRIKGTNGSTYSGTYFSSSGSYARVKRVKG